MSKKKNASSLISELKRKTTRNYASKEKIRIIIEGISIEDFNRLELLDNEFFIICLNYFMNHYFTGNEHINFSREKFLEQKKIIQNNFDDKIESFAISKMIVEYYEKCFGYSKGNIGLMQDIIKEYENEFTSKLYMDKLEKIKESLDSFEFKLSDNSLKLTKLVNPLGDTLTLGEIFKSDSKKIKVIDI